MLDMPLVSCRRVAKSYVRAAAGERPRAACGDCASGRELVAAVVDATEECSFTFAEPEPAFSMVIAEAVARCACGDEATLCARCALKRGGRMAS